MLKTLDNTTADYATQAKSHSVIPSDGKKPRDVRKLDQTVNKTKWADCIMAIANTQDRAAFAQLFAHFAPRVKSFLMKRGASDSEAEECAQDVMVTVWQKAHLFNPARAAASTWIFTIARNRHIDALRKAARPEPEDLPWGPTEQLAADEIVGIQQETDALAIAVKALPKNQRDMVIKAFYGELTHHEIADQTGLPLGTIKSRIRLGIERLRSGMTLNDNTTPRK